MSLVSLVKCGVDNVTSDHDQIRFFFAQKFVDKVGRVDEVLGVTIDPEVTELHDAERVVLVEGKAPCVLVDLDNFCWLVIRLAVIGRFI